MKIFPFLLAIIFLSSCASILSTNKYPVLVTSSPNGAEVTIKNLKGEIVAEGQTPLTHVLRSGAGYFKQAYYTVTFSLPEYEERTVPVRFEFDEMYWGNAIAGGVVGMFVVDPLTGAMYKLKDEYVHVVLRKPRGHASVPKFEVYDINEIPNEWKENLGEVK